jgi:hypothetical protein
MDPSFELRYLSSEYSVAVTNPDKTPFSFTVSEARPLRDWW